MFFLAEIVSVQRDFRKAFSRPLACPVGIDLAHVLVAGHLMRSHLRQRRRMTITRRFHSEESNNGTWWQVLLPSALSPLMVVGHLLGPLDFRECSVIPLSALRALCSAAGGLAGCSVVSLHLLHLLRRSLWGTLKNCSPPSPFHVAQGFLPQRLTSCIGSLGSPTRLSAC